MRLSMKTSEKRDREERLSRLSQAVKTHGIRHPGMMMMMSRKRMEKLRIDDTV